MPYNNNDYYRLLVPQAFVGLIDSISFMVVAPSVVFYVLSLGGTREQYGVILSVFSFSSFLFKPILGYWCDKSGYQFRLPYLASIFTACLGGFLYFFASAFSGMTAISILFCSRFLGGMGAANSTLGFTYVATIVPQDQMTKFTSLLGMVRVMGMVSAPALNILLSDMHGSIGSIEITPLNAVGLFLFASNLASAVVVYCYLEDPSEDVKPDKNPIHGEARGWMFYKSFLSLDVLLPLLNILHFNANFQLLETGLAPAASDLLGWGPVGISSLFGFNALLMLGLMALIFQLSSMKVTDETLLTIGLGISAIGYGSLYFLWQVGTTPLAFLTPFVLGTAAFPFLGSPTRSIFTRTINAHPTLREHQGSMQAIMSMGASVAGFAAPSLIATFILRTPDELATSGDKHEFTAWALFAPVFSTSMLIGFLYLFHCRSKPTQSQATGDEEDLTVSETSSLLRTAAASSSAPVHFHPRTEAYRRHSVTLMEIPQVSFHETASRGGRKSMFF